MNSLPFHRIVGRRKPALGGPGGAVGGVGRVHRDRIAPRNRLIGQFTTWHDVARIARVSLHRRLVHLGEDGGFLRVIPLEKG